MIDNGVVLLLAYLQDLHVAHVFHKGLAFGNNLLQLLNTLPQGQVVLQPALLDLRNIKKLQMYSLLTKVFYY